MQSIELIATSLGAAVYPHLGFRNSPRYKGFLVRWDSSPRKANACNARKRSANGDQGVSVTTTGVGSMSGEEGKGTQNGLTTESSTEHEEDEDKKQMSEKSMHCQVIRPAESNMNGTEKGERREQNDDKNTLMLQAALRYFDSVVNHNASAPFSSWSSSSSHPDDRPPQRKHRHVHDHDKDPHELHSNSNSSRNNRNVHSIRRSAARVAALMRHSQTHTTRVAVVISTPSSSSSPSPSTANTNTNTNATNSNNDTKSNNQNVIAAAWGFTRPAAPDQQHDTDGAFIGPVVADSSGAARAAVAALLREFKAESCDERKLVVTMVPLDCKNSDDDDGRTWWKRIGFEVVMELKYMTVRKKGEDKKDKGEEDVDADSKVQAEAEANGEVVDEFEVYDTTRFFCLHSYVG